MTKAERIKNSLQETKGRRKSQKAAVFQLKLQNLSKKKTELLNRTFAEAKWLYNWLVSDITRLSLPVNRINKVDVKVRETFEKRELTLLGSQVKQSIGDRLKDNLRALAKLKKNGFKVGALKYKKFVNSIPLKQYGITYKLDFDRNRVRIQKLGYFRILGLHQIPNHENVEIANAILVRKPSGFYLHVTCYLPKEYFKRELVGESIGIDFGIDSKLTLSNGLKIDFELHETDRLKSLQRKIARAKKGSSNRQRLRNLLRREYEKISNRRKDIQNKIIGYLKLYGKVIFQDDFIKGWETLFGKQVNSSGIGGIKSRLRNSLETPIVLDRFEPTTKECFACGKSLELSLSDRWLECNCGWCCDRDVNSALVIQKKGASQCNDNNVGLDRSEVKPPERETAVRILGSNPHVRISFSL